MKLPKLQEFWVSDTHSDPKENKVYKVKGFKTIFKKDRYYNAEESYLIFNNKNELCPISRYESDFQIFDTENEAIIYKNKRENYWLDWYKKQVKEYQDKIDQYKT